MNEKSEKQTVTVIAMVLWLVTAVLSVLALITIRDMFLRTLARFALNTLIPAANWIILFPMVAFCIAVIIGGFEFHFRNPGSARSWQILSWTFGIEVAILLLALFI